MSGSAFERLQKVAEERRQKELAAKKNLEIVPAVIEDWQENSTPTTTPTGTGTSTRATEQREFPVAPVNNFQKVTNTITKQAIPQRLFKTGKTKEIYDVLYSLTRGAIVPQRIIVISKPKLRSLTGVGSRITIDTCLGYLEIVGLVRVTKNVTGQHEGNEYEVFTPEEIGNSTGTSTPATTGTSTGGSPAQTLGVVAGVVTTRSSTRSELMDTGTLNSAKTSLNTNTKNDDDSARLNEAFSVMTKRFDEASKKLTGKEISKSETEKWGTLADLLILELEVVASRVEGISSIPAFLTEVLRRQLFAARQPKSSSAKPSKTKPDKVGEPEQHSYEIKPLDKAGREAALAELCEFADEDFLEDFKKWYTPEDWNWLITEIKKAEKNEK